MDTFRSFAFTQIFLPILLSLCLSLSRSDFFPPYLCSLFGLVDLSFVVVVVVVVAFLFAFIILGGFRSEYFCFCVFCCIHQS